MNYCDVFYYKVDNTTYPEGLGEPSERYPELENLKYIKYSKKKNEVYEAVRTILFELGYDKENYNTLNWNPLKNVIKKHQKVLLKPNMVFHEHPYGEQAVMSMVTNYSILRPLIDYIILATEGEVEIIIGDCPVQTAIFSEVSRISGIEKLYNFYRELGYNIKLIDMRMLITKVNRQGIKEKRTENPSRKESDYITVDLKEKSALMSIIEKANRLEITDYKKGAVSHHHNSNKNEYVVPREVLEADLIINVPKLKTHRKAGMTCAMKNLVGINGDKTCIAHHMRGTKAKGGDEFNEFNMLEWGKVRIWTFLKRTPIGIKLAGIIKTFFQKYVWKGKSLKEHNMQVTPQYFSEGSWYGNDTIWRCVKDLNRIVLYADKNGEMKEKVQRNYLCIVDAVLAGEGEGPMEQTEKQFGVVFGGGNPVYVDYVASILMKYNYKDIPTIFNGFKNEYWNLVYKKSSKVVYSGNKDLEKVRKYFIPTFGWQKKLKEKQ